jgi:hypothetical protein
VAELVYAVYYYDYQDLMHFAVYYPSFVVSDLVHEQDTYLAADIQLDIFKNRVFQNGEPPNDEGIYGKFVEREIPGYANFPAVYLPGFRLKDRGLDRYDANGQYPWNYGWLTG